MRAAIIFVYVVVLSVARGSAGPVIDNGNQLAAVATAVNQTLDSLVALSETAEESHGMMQSIAQSLASINTMLHKFMHKFMMPLHCPEGGITIGTQCFFIPKVGIKKKSWDEAQEACKEQGGILPEPRDPWVPTLYYYDYYYSDQQRRYNKFHHLINNTWSDKIRNTLHDSIDDPESYYSGIWLGGSDREQEGVWKWASDGARLEVPIKKEPVPEWATKFDNTSGWRGRGGTNWWDREERYHENTNWWYPGEPNNYNGNEHCLFMMTDQDFPYDDRNCGEGFHFICEKL